jgi:hypothetical protein
MGAKRVSKQGVTVSTGNAIEVTNTSDAVLFSVDNTGAIGRIANLTAKGSILTASATSTPAALAVGANGETLVADSSTSTGLRYTENYAAGKNKIINGDFTINQRALTSTTTSGAYGFDRFQWSFTGGSNTYSAQTFTAGAAPVAGYEAINFARIATTGQSAVGDFCYLFQKIEDVRTFAGQTVTFSFWAKASSGTPNVGISIEQQFGAGGSAVVVVNGGVKAITTSWARYSATIAIPSVSGKTIGTAPRLIAGLFTSAGTTLSGAGYPAVGIQNTTIDFWGIQVEAGSVATAFQTATGTLQGELAAAQRYYFRSTATGNAFTQMCFGSAISTTSSRQTLSLPVPMRTVFTSIDYGNLVVSDQDGGTYAISAITNASSSPSYVSIDCAITSATQYRPQALTANNNTAAFLGFSAEL